MRCDVWPGLAKRRWTGPFGDQASADSTATPRPGLGRRRCELSDGSAAPATPPLNLTRAAFCFARHEVIAAARKLAHSFGRCMSKKHSATDRRRQIAEATTRLAALNRRFNEGVHRRSENYVSARDSFLGRYDQLAFPGGLAKRLEELERQDPEAVEDAICFLEVDPWFFRSGYIKERILHLLKRCHLTARQRERLQQCIVRSVEGGSRRVFARYARLGGVHASNALMTAIESRLDSADPEVRRRASHVLAVIRSRIAANNAAQPRRPT